jgi:hypothetical protein
MRVLVGLNVEFFGIILGLLVGYIIYLELWLVISMIFFLMRSVGGGGGGGGTDLYLVESLGLEIV